MISQVPDILHRHCQSRHVYHSAADNSIGTRFQPGHSEMGSYSLFVNGLLLPTRVTRRLGVGADTKWYSLVDS